jgi:hypothetical protein
MAHHWRVDAWGNHDGAVGDLLGAVLYGPLGLESADMKTIIEMAREAGFTELEFYGNKLGTNPTECLERFAELVRADERGRMCEQCKECLNEKSTSNEANRPAFLGEGGQAN